MGSECRGTTFALNKAAGGMGLGAEQFTWADEFTFLIFISFFSFPSEDGEMKLKI